MTVSLNDGIAAAGCPNAVLMSSADILVSSRRLTGAGGGGRLFMVGARLVLPSGGGGLVYVT